MENFLCGGLAASMAIIIMNPVDVVKTRLQMQGELSSVVVKAGVTQKPTTATVAPLVYRGIISALVQIARREGWRGLQSGLVAALALQFSVTATRFGVYAFGKRVMGIEQDTAQNFTANLILALVAGACGATCGCPFYGLKTQFQNCSKAPELAVGYQHHHSSVWSALRLIYKTTGLRGYWRGLEAFLPRVVAFSGMQLSTYDTTKHFLLSSPRTPAALAQDGIGVHLLSSAIAAMVAVTAMQPFDFLAARLMNQPLATSQMSSSSSSSFPASPSSPYYSGPVDCARKVLATEGPLALFKGASANYARMVPYTILTFVFFEQFKRATRWM